MSLDNIKDMTATARDNLVNAIRTKGVSVADDSTINQCANAVLMISGGSGSCKYYKCASVDAANKTWSGYELILTDGVYSVSDAVTEGLQYSSVTPVVGNTYSEDALVLASPYMGYEAPIGGLVFYAPLSGASDTAETGQAITTVGTVQYSVIKGIPCAGFSGRSVGYLNAEPTNMPYNDQARTISVWFYIYSGSTHGSGTTLFSYGNVDGYSGGSWYSVHASPMNSCFYMGFYGYDMAISCDLAFDTWYHLCLKKEQGSADTLFYLNGKYIGVHNKNRSSAPTEREILRFGTICYNNSADGLNGNLAAFRVYNRALTQEEITTLANEFTPTAA